MCVIKVLFGTYFIYIQYCTSLHMHQSITLVPYRYSRSWDRRDSNRAYSRPTGYICAISFRRRCMGLFERRYNRQQPQQQQQSPKTDQSQLDALW